MTSINNNPLPPAGSQTAQAFAASAQAQPKKTVAPTQTTAAVQVTRDSQQTSPTLNNEQRRAGTERNVPRGSYLNILV